MATKKWNAEIMFPKDSCYQVRVIDLIFSDSKSSGNPMITLQWELTAPTTVEVGDDIIEIVGSVKGKQYLATTTVFSADGKTVDEEATKVKRDKFIETLKTLKVGGKPVIDVATINWDNPNLSALKGKILLVSMESEVKEDRKTPTKSDLEEAKKKGIDASQAGKIMKDPVTGKDLVKYWPKVRSIFGIAAGTGGGY